MSKRRLSGYTEVFVRVNAFRADHPIEEGWAIQTEILDINDTSVLVRAVILDPDGRLIAAGHAEEIRGSSQVNRTNPVENCETSAIGRALAACGYGGDQAYASTNEIQSAKARQSKPKNVRSMPEAASSPAASTHERVSMKALQAMCTTCGLGKDDRELRLRFAELLIPYPLESYSDLKAPDREIVYKTLRYIRDRYAELDDEEELIRRRACISYVVGKGERISDRALFKATIQEFDERFWNDEKAA